MKSIKQQYIDLQEGNMSQANFMRNLRMTLPQYVTNITSFEDSVRILKNKGILTEADEKTKWTNTSGKSMYDQFKEIDNLNGHEVLNGIDYEMEKNHELTKEEAAKIVIKNLKKNPIYYTAQDMSGVEGYEPEYLGGKSANAEARHMQPLDKNMSNVVDKKMGMQPVKGIEKAKKDADAKKETNKMEKGVSLMSLIAKTVRGVKKMDATGEKMKKITMKEAKLNNFPGEEPNATVQSAMQFINSNPTLKQYSDNFTLQNSNDRAILKYNYWEAIPEEVFNKLELQFEVEEDVEEHDDQAPTIAYILTPKHTPGKINLNKIDLMKMIREELNEMFDGMEPMGRKGLYELSSQEQNVVKDILTSLDEGMFTDKIKSWAKKGAITLAVALTLLASTQLDLSQKKDVVQTIKTEKTVDQNVKDVSDARLAIDYYNMYKDKIDKAAENDTELKSTVKEINRMIKDKETNNETSLKFFGKYYKPQIEKLIKIF